MVTVWRWPFRLDGGVGELAERGRCGDNGHAGRTQPDDRREGRRAAMAATVLIVEDERRLRELVRSYLRYR